MKKNIIHGLIYLLLLTLTILTLNGCGDGGGVNITDADTSANSATLLWDTPTTNTDGTDLTDLAGYKVYYSTESGNYTASIDVGKFGGYYTKTGPLSRETGKRLSRALEIRRWARYRSKINITYEMAEENLALAREMICHLEKILGEKPSAI